MSNVLKVIIAIILALAIALLGNGLIWWGVGALFIWAFDIAYTWTFAKGFAVGLVLFVASPVKIKFNTNDFIKEIIGEAEGGDDIE